MSTLQEKKKLLQLRKDEVRLLEQEIARLTLEEEEKQKKQPKPVLTFIEKFPIGSSVLLIGKREQYRLRGKKAEVIGHTDQFVKLSRKGESFIRRPENLKLVEK